MPSQQSPAPGHDRLNGWKEIAGFLGKGVRTVQRWERDFGLPVHRIGHEGGEIVYALRNEIDRWSEAAERGRGLPNGSDHHEDQRADGDRPTTGHAHPQAPAVKPAADEVGAAGRTARPNAEERRPQGLSFAAVLALGVALGLLAYVAVNVAVRSLGALRPGPPAGRPTSGGARPTTPAQGAHTGAPTAQRPRPGDAGATTAPEAVASVRIVGNRIDALDHGGGVIWSHQFDFEVNPFWRQGQGPNPGQEPVIADLDGNGSTEVAVLVRQQDMSGDLYVFNEDGTTRFVVSPDASVTFGEVTYAGPWLAHRAFMTGGPSQRRRLWAVFVHKPLFPSLVLELDSEGAVTSRYWSNGHVEFVGEAVRNGRQVLLVGAANNEHKGASLAVFDPGKIGGSAPAVTAKYRCVSCPAGGPEEFVVFPRACWLQAGPGMGTGAVREAWVDALGRLNAQVDAGGEEVDGATGYSGWIQPVTAYTVDLRAADASVEVDRSHLLVHRQHERTGRLDHPFNDADRQGLLKVLRWQNGRFVLLRPGRATQ